MQSDRGRKGCVRSRSHVEEPEVRRDLPPPGQLGRPPEEARLGSGSESKQVGTRHWQGKHASQQQEYLSKRRTERNKAWEPVGAGRSTRSERRRGRKTGWNSVRHHSQPPAIRPAMCTRQFACVAFDNLWDYFSLK